ncbi:MAG: putative sulfate/molybdate transporter, partial [Anaerolineae bacterium]
MAERSFKFDLAELGGALGDVGTLIPLLAALIAVNGLDPTSVFLVVGLAYLLSGLYYRLPMPIQPLKAVSAVAISLGLSASVVSASGLWMGAILLILSLTGLMRVLARLFPQSVVRGIQLAVGLLLVRSGLLLAAKSEVLIGGQASSVRIASLTLPLGWLLAGVTGLILVACLRARRWLASLAVLGFGFLVSVAWGSMEGLGEIHLGLTLPRLAWPSVEDATSALV